MKSVSFLISTRYNHTHNLLTKILVNQNTVWQFFQVPTLPLLLLFKVTYSAFLFRAIRLVCLPREPWTFACACWSRDAVYKTIADRTPRATYQPAAKPLASHLHYRLRVTSSLPFPFSKLPTASSHLIGVVGCQMAKWRCVCCGGPHFAVKCPRKSIFTTYKQCPSG